MDPDSNYNDEQKETSNSVPNDRYVFESNGVRPSFFFGLYFFFSGNNPIKEISDVIRSIYEDKIKHYYCKFKNKNEKI